LVKEYFGEKGIKMEVSWEDIPLRCPYYLIHIII
jgi:hypothetical protein